MNNQVQVTFHNTLKSKKITNLVHEKLDKLETRFKKITSCSVRVDKPHNHLHKGNEYQVEVTMAIPHFTATGHAHNAHRPTAVSEAIEVAAKRATKFIEKKRSRRGTKNT